MPSRVFHRPRTRLLALYSAAIFVIISIGCSDGWRYPVAFTNNNRHHHDTRNVFNSNVIRIDNEKTIYYHHGHRIILQASDTEDTEDKLKDTTQALDNDDELGTPLFDTNDSATLFGLEPNNAEGIDPLDNGLQFTGPIIMFASIYVCLSLVFGGGMPL